MFRGLLDEMREDWNTLRDKHELDVMWKYAKMSRFCCIVFFTMNRSTLITHTISHAWFPVKFLVSGSNETGDWPLHIIGSLPYDHQKHGIYELTIVLQILCMTFASWCYDSTDSFFVRMMTCSEGKKK